MREHYGTEPPEGEGGWTYAGAGRWTREGEGGGKRKSRARGKDGTRPRIAVVGGGPGGLFTAYILNQRLPRARVTVFEAGDRVGGKICTDDFSDGTPFESGVAELYEYLGPGDGDPMRSLIEDDLGLKTVDISGGAVVLCDRVLRDLDELEEEHGCDTRRRVEAFHAKMVELMPLEKYAHRWQPDNDHPWAGKTFRECIEAELRGSDGVVDEVARSYIEAAVASDLATESHTCNGLNGIKNVLMDNDEYMQVYHVVGGIERVVDALVEKISAKVVLGARATAIGRSERQVRLPALSIGEGDPPDIVSSPELLLAGAGSPTSAGGDSPPLNGVTGAGGEGDRGTYRVSLLKVGDDDISETDEEFDAVIVALPNHWLRTIKWDGKLAEAIHETCAHYDLPAHYLRVSVLFDEKWWADLEMPGEFWMMDMLNGCCCYDESTRWARHHHSNRQARERDGRWIKLSEDDEVEVEAEPEEGGGADARGHVLSFLIAGGDALLLCSSDQDDDCIVEYVLQSLPPSMRQRAEDHAVEAQVDRYVGSINAQPGGWPAEELRGEHVPEPEDHPGVLLVGDYFFDSTLNAALMSAACAVELLLEYLGAEGEPGTEAIQSLATDKTGV